MRGACVCVVFRKIFGFVFVCFAVYVNFFLCTVFALNLAGNRYAAKINNRSFAVRVEKHARNISFS